MLYSQDKVTYGLEPRSFHMAMVVIVIIPVLTQTPGGHRGEAQRGEQEAPPGEPQRPSQGNPKEPKPGGNPPKGEGRQQNRNTVRTTRG